jgi:hypothetical protein
MTSSSNVHEYVDNSFIDIRIMEALHYELDHLEAR